MRSNKTFPFPALLRALALVACMLSVQTAYAQFVYVGDYTGKDIARFDAPNANVTTSPNGNPTGKYIDTNLTTSFSGSYNPEGMGGIGNTLFIAGSDGAIHIYNASGSTGIATGIISAATTGFTNGGLRINFSPDGTIMYAAGDNATGGVVDSFTQTGGVWSRTHQRVISTAGIWGVATNPLTGQVYYTTGWRGGDTSASVVRVNADLTSPTTLVAINSTPSGKIAGTNTNASKITGLAGIAFKSDGTFYVVNGANADASNDFIQHYNANGTFIDQVNLTGMPAGALQNAFDTEIGPGGDLYVSAQNGNCVLRFNSTTDTFVSGYVPAGADSILSAKTLHFTTNNVAGTPEPGAWAAFACLSMSGTLVVLRRRKVSWKRSGSRRS